MRLRALVVSYGLVLGGFVSAFAQQPTGPATLENLLNAPDRPPLKLPATDADGPFPPVVPDDAAVKEAQELIRQAYEDDYKAASKNPEPLIQKLLADAGQTKDPVRKYAYLISAEEAAVMGGDCGRTMELIDIRAGQFVLDGIQSRIARLAEFLTPDAKKDPEALRKLYEHAIETAQLGMKQNSFEQAKTAAEMAASIAKSLFLGGKAKKNESVANDGETKQTQAKALVKDITRRAGLFAEYQQALETLKAKEDPAANGVIGRYLCFEASDWEKGLPFLAKSDQKDLAEVAAQELKLFAAGRPDAKEVFALAGRWWGVGAADEVSKSRADIAKAHAGKLYASLEGALTDPLDLQLARKRSAEAVENGRKAIFSGRAPSPQQKNGDLLAVTQVPRDVMSGQWERVANGVVVHNDGQLSGSRLCFPVELPKEYEVTISFTRNWGNDGFGLYATRGDAAFLIQLSAVSGQWAGLNEIKGGSACRVQSPNLGNARHVLVVAVRDEGVSASCDGRLLFKQATDYTNIVPDRYGFGESRLGLISWLNDVTFHKVELRALSR